MAGVLSLELREGRLVKVIPSKGMIILTADAEHQEVAEACFGLRDQSVHTAALFRDRCPRLELAPYRMGFSLWMVNHTSLRLPIPLTCHRPA